MRPAVTTILSLLLAIEWVGAAPKSSEHLPVEITSTGETKYEDGLATARDNVAIHIGDTDIYADFAQYNSRTKEISLEGNVRIYRELKLYLADRGVYNTETKEIRGADTRIEYGPYFLDGDSLTTISENGYRVQNGSLTTHDSSKPDFHFRAHTVRVYENDHVTFQNVTFYVGNVPVFWWPYLYQSLDDSFSFTISPAYLSSWGESLLSQVTFPITDNIRGRLRLDLRARRGVAIGFESDIDYGKNNSSWAKLKTYYIQDQNPFLNRTSLPRGTIDRGRYRVSVEDHTDLTSDIYGIANITKVSDAFVIQDFYPRDFQIDPVPDNMVAVAKTNSLYTLTAITRFQANNFFEQTERLPEVVLDIKRHALFGGPIFYEGETGVADLQRSFASGSGFQDYGTTRFDTFHQLLYPNTYLGWLSIVPRVGFRGTYYGETRDLGKTIFPVNDNFLQPNFLLPDPTPAQPIQDGGDKFRTILNAGVEASFKLSRAWEEVQNRSAGLDGIRHIIQPFTNFSYVWNNGVNPAAILQFDRFEPSTQLRPIDFPQFTSIDSIASWTIWRAGVRNRLQTRRDDLTVSWLDLETYIDINIDNPFDRTPYSNLFNTLRFNPLPWASLALSSQIPAFDKGFTEVNSNIVFQPVANLQFNVGHRYLNNSPFFDNSSLVVVGGYYRFDDNWGVGVQEQYETSTHTLEQQRYSLYRDLTSWVASIGAVIRDNGGVKEYGVLLTFTLKAFPKFGFDLNFDPAAAGETP